MPSRLEKKLSRLKAHVVNLGDKVERIVEDSLRAVLDRNAALARDVINSDREIDLFEIEIEEDCLACLALDQPVAMDLRFIVAVLKINSDLERIADLAVKIAEQAEPLATRSDRRAAPFDVRHESKLAMEMITRAVDARVAIDADMARSVLDLDDEVDRIHAGSYEAIRLAIMEDPERTGELLRYLSVSRCLERIADHATNIAEDIIYTVRGDIERHARD